MGNKDPSQISDETLIWGITFFFVLVILNKAYDFLSVWIQEPAHQLILLILCLLSLTPLFYWLARKCESNLKRIEKEKAVIGKSENSVFCGETDQKEEVHIKTRQRAMHTQVIGTTNAGKTESVILPWAIQDIEQGRGLILIDGKSDRSLLDKLWSYSVKHNRQKDFRLFSLSSIEESHQFKRIKH